MKNTFSQKFIWIVLAFTGFSIDALSQGIAVNTDGSAAHTSAMLDVKSTNRGFLAPRMTEAQRDAIAAPAAGLIIFQNNNAIGYYYFNGTSWLPLAGSSSSPWITSGPNIYNNNAGSVGIGTTTPGAKLEVRGASSQMRITDATSGNSLVLQGGAGVNMKVTGYNYGTGAAQPLYLSVDGANTLLNSNGGNVGIGTTAPANKLTVNSDFYGIEHTDGTARLSTFLNSAGGWLGTLSNHPLHFFTNDGGQRMTINTAGQVGIGTSTPSALLHINGSQKIQANNTLEFGAGLTKELNAGKIGYATFTVGALDIIGAGTTMANRTIRFWNEGGAIFGGNVGIHTTNTSSYSLSVNGSIRSKEVVVESGWADYVFADDYDLKSLQEVEKFIKIHKHLPGIPSAVEIEKNGLQLGNTQKKMMEKIEELTLYVIDLKKEIDTLKASKNEN